MPTAAHPSVELFPLTPRDWGRFQTDLLRFEREYFPPRLREDPVDLQSLIESPTSIVIGVRTDRATLAGYIASDVLERFGDVPGTCRDPHWGHGDTHYIASVVVVPNFRDLGIGTALTKRCVCAAYQRGFRRVTAHIEAGAARKIDDRIRLLASYPDWYGTRRVFEYVVLPLRIAE